jgi:hypothetical protein
MCWFILICWFEDDVETQRKGAIMIAWMMDCVRLDEEAGSSFANEMRLANYWMPMRLLNGIHLCIDKTQGKQLLAKVLSAAVVDRQLRPNFKIHEGAY